VSDAGAMTSLDALRLLHAVRRDHDVVISAMGAARDWMALGTHPRDWVFVPSSMGQATSLGLGLALARPDLRIIVLGGDGGLIMNLGSLITITGQAPANLFILIFDNGVYEVTGAQPTPAAPAGRPDAPPVDLAALARASGFETVFRFGTLDEWQRNIEEVLASRGPVFAILSISSLRGAPGPRSPGPAPERARRFMAELLGRKGTEPAS
jgi:thiamine pyrophosphate-dependent acetolactate synthase large subunit-like protein